MNGLFTGQTLEDYFKGKIDEIINVIKSEPDDFLKSFDEENYIEQFTSEYSIGEIVLNYDEIYQDEVKGTRIQKKDYFGNRFDAASNLFTIHIPYTGNRWLLNMQPNLYFTGRDQFKARVGNQNDVVIEVVSDEAPKRIIEEAIHQIKKLHQTANEDVRHFNNNIEPIIRSEIMRQKERIKQRNSLALSLNIPIRKWDAAPKTFSVPMKRKKVSITRPVMTATSVTPDPSLSMNTYESILEMCLDMSLVMERNLLTFSKLGEETIRDLFLVVLNAQFQGEATGETFNGKGKTDILVRHENSNIFIVECKIWSGPGKLLETIDQLLGYTTWRDTKTAIFIFNRNKNFTAVLNKTEETIKSHKLFINKIHIQNIKLHSEETVFPYKFRHPSDAEREIYITFMVFDTSEP
jgi:hypothetical protein